MTNKEAKEKLYMEWQKFLEDNIDYAGVSEAYKMAFKALEQEPCEDAISRQEVLYLIADDDLSMGQVVKGIHALPSVTPQEPRWIPVKDRLPQKSEYGDVLVTFIPTAGTLWATVMIARYSDLMGIAKPCFHIGEVGKKSFENITSQVIAWMPLQKPYKAEIELQKSEEEK